MGHYFRIAFYYIVKERNLYFVHALKAVYFFHFLVVARYSTLGLQKHIKVKWFHWYFIGVYIVNRTLHSGVEAELII